MLENTNVDICGNNQYTNDEKKTVGFVSIFQSGERGCMENCSNSTSGNSLLSNISYNIMIYRNIIHRI